MPAGGPLEALSWLAPAVRLFALSWVSCIIMGFLGGDLLLVFTLLLLASSADLLLCFASSNPRVRQNSRPEAASALGWAVPLAFVIAGVCLRIGALRPGEMTVAGLLKWQADNGILLGSAVGGAFAQVGTALALVAALICALALMRLRPFGRGYFSDAPGGVAADLSGPPLAALRMSEAASLFVVPLLVVALFLGGPASTWYEVVFWVLKAVGFLLLFGIADLMSARLRSDRVVLWLLGAGSALALAGLLLVWVGVAK